MLVFGVCPAATVMSPSVGFDAERQGSSSPAVVVGERCAVPGLGSRESGGEDAGVDGSSDGGVMADGGADGCSGDGFDVGGVECSAGFGDERRWRRVGVVGGLSEGEVAGPGDEEAAVGVPGPG